MNKFRIEVNQLIKSCGRKKWWLAQKMGMSVTHLRRKLKGDLFEDTDKNKIRRFLKND